MTDRIDCSSMSHLSCLDIGDAEPAAPTERPTASNPEPTRRSASALHDTDGRLLGGASYDCVNDCVSSQGVAVLLSGATASLGCLMVPPACPVFVGASVGTILGACEAACENLETQP